VVITRRWAVFLIAVGIWSWVIWPRFGLAIWDDDRSFANGAPTSFLWVHAVLIAVSLGFGTAVGVLGVRAWPASRLATAATEEITAEPAAAPKD
jgi:hypothetical protein